MKEMITLVLLFFFVIACESRAPSQRKPGDSPIPKVTVEREKVKTESPLPPEVKIKVRRDGKDNYTWELNGSDVDAILKVNEKLRKGLAVEQPR